MPKSTDSKLLELEQKVNLLEKQKAQLESQIEKADKKAILFDMMIDLATYRLFRTTQKSEEKLIKVAGPKRSEILNSTMRSAWFAGNFSFTSVCKQMHVCCYPSC